MRLGSQSSARVLEQLTRSSKERVLRGLGMGFGGTGREGRITAGLVIVYKPLTRGTDYGAYECTSEKKRQGCPLALGCMCCALCAIFNSLPQLSRCQPCGMAETRQSWKGCCGQQKELVREVSLLTHSGTCLFRQQSRGVLFCRSCRAERGKRQQYVQVVCIHGLCVCFSANY